MENYKDVKFISLPFIHCLFVGCIFFPVFLFGQSNKFERDSLQAAHFYQTSLEWKEKEVLDSAIVYAKKSAQLYSDLKLWEACYDSDYEVWSGLYALWKLEETIEYLQFSEKSVLGKADNPVYIARIRGWIGVCYYYLESFEKAMENYLVQVRLLEETGNKNEEYGDLGTIGVLYTMRGDYDQALNYLKKAESIYRKKGDERTLKNVYWNLGVSYASKEDYEKGIESFESYLKVGGNELGAFTSIGKIYRDQGALGQAMDYAKNALDEFNKKASLGYLEEGEHPGAIYKLMGSIHYLEMDYQNAIDHFQKAYFFLKKSIIVDNRELGKLYVWMGDAYLGLKKYDLALDVYQSALTTLIPSFTATEITINPDLDVFELANGVWIMEALRAKGICFQKQYKQDQDIEKLKRAVACYEDAFKTIDVLRYHQEEESSKKSLIDYAHPLYEKALSATMLLYQQTGSAEYLNQAFTFSQKTKAFLLASALQNINAQEQGGVPDSLIQKEKYLKAMILENSQEMLKVDTTEHAISIQELEAQRFDAIRDLQRLMNRLERDYPAYYQLKYKQQWISIAEIQAQLPSHRMAMIDYFLGDSTVFILCISKDEIAFQDLPRTVKLDQAIQQFMDQCGNAQFVEGGTKAYKEFTDSGYYLFQQLLEQPLAKLGAGIEQLVLVPDGVLNKLPFEALMMTLPQSTDVNYSTTNLSYLLEAYMICYLYAPQIFSQGSEHTKKDADKLFAGFAPTFSGTGGGEMRSCSGAELKHLKYNQVEVETIAGRINGDLFTGRAASLASFTSQAKDYRILHLATHACMSEDNSLEHKIYFANDEFLSGAELFTLHLQADMVVLSACETGVGEVVKGEGVMSLARGFSYTGCPSVIMSLWSVPDQASSDIMIQFYENLQKNWSKDKALHEAKLTFIKNQKSIRHHPYYWAAFVPIGNTETIDFNQVRGGWLWFTVLGFLAILGFSLFRLRTK